MVACCMGPVNVDEQNSVICLVHYSVQEYLEKHRNLVFPSGEGMIAEASITYLLSDVFALGCYQDQREILALISEHPLSDTQLNIGEIT